MANPFKYKYKIELPFPNSASLRGVLKGPFPFPWLRPAHPRTTGTESISWYQTASPRDNVWKNKSKKKKLKPDKHTGCAGSTSVLSLRGRTWKTSVSYALEPVNTSTLHRRPDDVHGLEMVGGAWRIRVDLSPSLGLLRTGHAFPAEVRRETRLLKKVGQMQRCSFEVGGRGQSQGMWAASLSQKEQGAAASPGASEGGARACQHLDSCPRGSASGFYPRPP